MHAPAGIQQQFVSWLDLRKLVSECSSKIVARVLVVETQTKIDSFYLL